MTEKLRLLELLEEAMDSDLAPEELCAQYPQLIPELRRRLEQCRVVRDELDVLFPSEALPFEETAGSFDDSYASLPAVAGYEVYSVLGRGGMGVVYKARHLALKRLVAIKMLLAGVHGGAGERVRIRREAEALAKLTHPHIVQVYDVGELEGRPYFTMEIMGGGSLGERLGGVPQPTGYTASMLINLAEAVEAAHRCGIVHRDLKPANVLLTVEGVPKISDFGLARHVEDADLLTLPWARMGTPSYMAPEQASRRWGEVGRASDVYALGAILYEMMTGRPPFRGESPADTERQLLHEEVVPPSRLNARVPRDLETICLKCLQKDRERRYASASALADDLKRFEKGEPIRARRVGPMERGVKLIRRRPATATALGSAAALALVIAGGGTWFVSQRSASRRAVEADLSQAVESQRAGAWTDAVSAMERASIHLGGNGPEYLRRRLDAVRSDAKLVDLLDAIRLKGEAEREQRIDVDYRAALTSAKFGGPEDPAEVVAARMRASHVNQALVTALDDWLCVSVNDRPWVLEVLRRADHDPTGWRDRVRDNAVWNNREALARAALDAPYADQPVTFLLSMDHHLSEMHLNDESKINLMKRIHEAHPEDFWINYNLGIELGRQQRVPEQLQYLQAAAAIRPRAHVVRTALGKALMTTGRHSEAIVQFRKAVILEPHDINAWELLGSGLAQDGQDVEAISRLQQALSLNPGDPREIYYYLGISLQRLGHLTEAVPAFRRAMSKGPYTEAQQALQGILIDQGQWGQVESVWKDMTKVDPANFNSWDGYPEFCLFLGRTDDYRRLRGILLDRFAKERDPIICDRAGRACLLLGDDPKAIALAAAMTDRALHAGSDNSWFRPYFAVGKGLAEYRAGNFNAARAALEGNVAPTLKPMPQLIDAMVHYRLGNQQGARKLFAEAVLSFDWSRQNANRHEYWIDHILRREAEQLIIPNFNALLDGSAQPRDNDERLALLGACAFDELRGRSAQLWIDAFATGPQLGVHIEDVARAAAAAGAGQGKDVAKYTDDDRARWRNSAIALLTKRIDTLESILNSANPQKAAVQNDLLALQRSPDLAGLREASALTHLPKAEQDECTALWSRIHTVLDRSN